MGFHQCISPPCLKRLHSCTEEAESRKNERFFKGGLDEKYALGASLPNVCLVFRIWPGGDCPSHDSGVVLFFQEGTPCTNNSFPSRVITLSWQQGRGTGSATRVCGSLSLPRLLNRPPARLPALSLALSDGEWTTISASMANLPIPICQGLKAFFFLHRDTSQISLLFSTHPACFKACGHVPQSRLFFRWQKRVKPTAVFYYSSHDFFFRVEASKVLEGED